KDANNQPIIGATVSLANSNLATATDANGYFRLSVPVQSGNLIVTALGFTSRTLAFQQGQVLQVGLSASLSGLDEVIIVGYGTQKKELVTSAIGSFKVKDEDVRQVASPTRLLEGRIAGVNVSVGSGNLASGERISVRGFSSISAGNNPLYVIDGVPINTAN